MQFGLIWFNMILWRSAAYDQEAERHMKAVWYAFKELNKHKYRE